MLKTLKTSTGKLFLLFSVVPILLFTIAFTLIASSVIQRIKTEDTEQLLRASAKELVYAYELIGKNNQGFHMEGYELYAGDVRIMGDNSIVDRLKEYSGVDFSFFWKDMRLTTTIRDELGNRIVRTYSSLVWDYVSEDQEYWDKDISVHGVPYYAYYIPVHSQDGEVVGMGFAGIPTAEFNRYMERVTRFIVKLAILGSLLAAMCVIFMTRKIIGLQQGLHRYCEEIQAGNYNHVMDKKLHARKDEYGQMGRMLVNLNESLISLIYRDPLTDLYNRRAGMKILAEYVKKANSLGNPEPFTFTICDIDHFKHVNDTYGHSCGDKVLQVVSNHLKKNVPPEEYCAIRWGGEEFVIVQKGKLSQNKAEIEVIADAIRTSIITYDGKDVQVTMTFGMAEVLPAEKLDSLISRADKLLYKGKETGRDKIVCS